MAASGAITTTVARATPAPPAGELVNAGGVEFVGVLVVVLAIVVRGPSQCLLHFG